MDAGYRLGRTGNLIGQALFGNRPSSAPALIGTLNYGEIDNRMCQAASMNRMGSGLNAAAKFMAAVRWVALVWPGSAWDDKHISTGGTNYDLEAQGNFAYGATAYGVGLSEQVALRGAGGAQRMSNFGRAFRMGRMSPSEGSPFGGAPYGDDRRDQAVISAGYRYGEAHPCRKK